VIQDTIKKLIDDALEALELPQASFVIEHPEKVDFGDFSTNIALVLSKQVGKNPRELASTISEELQKNLPSSISKIETAGPGFINFYLSKEFFALELKNILEKGEEYGTNKNLEGKKMLFEYTDPNPFKQFHIGHLMSNAIGESLSRIAEFQDARVTRISYGGDVGLHVAKTMWGILQKKDTFPADTDSISVKAKYLGEVYVLGSNAYEDDAKAQEEIKNLNKVIFEMSDFSLFDYYKKGKEWSVEHFHEIYKKLDTKFDHEHFESETISKGISLVEEFLEKGVFEKSEGAIVYRGEDEGLHTRVFINSQGLPTYEAKELGLTSLKFEKYNPDISVVITADEQTDYFKVILSVLGKINKDWAERTQHVAHGMMRFADGKMSSRKGNVITGESLILDTEEAVREIIKERELPEEIKNQIAEFVAVSAIKYSVLRQTPGGNIIFDKSKAISFEGDSGPYLQYTAVRANSVLEKAENSGTKREAKIPNFETMQKEIYKIEHLLYRFPEVVARAGDEKSPHHIVTYLTELASAFNGFYANNKIIDAGEESGYRLGITKAVHNILWNGLYLLGIRVPERM
jgi:arginyl-tRNA synthetase